MEDGKTKIEPIKESEVVPANEDKKLSIIDQKEEVMSIIEHNVNESIVEDYKTKEPQYEIIKQETVTVKVSKEKGSTKDKKTKEDKKEKREVEFDFVEASEKDDSDWDDYILL